MSLFTFDIQGTKLVVNKLIDEQESTTIHSCLGDYLLHWANCPPEESVMQLIKQKRENVLLIDEHLLDIYSGFTQIDTARTVKAKASENFKTLDGVVHLVNFLQESGITKSEYLVVAGGGIMQDLGAFVGACFRRGLPWRFVPTTLLSIADSCIGAKTGINHLNAKNQLALFSAPKEVVLNVNFLKTLSTSDLKSGMGEILKLCIIGGDYFVECYSNIVKQGLIQKFEDYRKLIGCALSVKQAVVEFDEFEHNIRRAMNYGHTFGHAIEVISNYKIAHGQAVSIGMIIANSLSTEYGILDSQNCEKLNQLAFELLDINTIEIMKNFETAQLLSLLRKDKKTENTKAMLILMKKPGQTVLHPTEINLNLEKLVIEIVKRTF